MTEHYELIECPECKSVQKAKVKHSIPFWDFTHKCKCCKNWIMESEWIEVDFFKIEDEELGLYIDLLI